MGLGIGEDAEQRGMANASPKRQVRNQLVQSFFILCQLYVRSELEKLPPKQQKTDPNPPFSATTKHFVFTSHEKLELSEQPQGELCMQTRSQQCKTRAILSWAHTVGPLKPREQHCCASISHSFVCTDTGGLCIIYIARSTSPNAFYLLLCLF